MKNISHETKLQRGGLTWWHAIVGFVLSATCAVFPSMILATVLSSTIEDPAQLEKAINENTYLMLPVQFFLMFIVGVVAIRILRGKKHSNKDLGFVWRPTNRAFTYGALGGALFVVIATIGSSLLPDISEAGKKVVSQVGMGENMLRDFIIVLSATIAAPLGEELIYRGIIFRGLYNWFLQFKNKAILKLAFIVPALVSATLFAIAHGGEGQDKQVVFLTIFGLIVAGLYWWTGSLYVAVFAHSITNAINFFIMSISATKPVSPLIYILIFISPLITIGIMRLTQKLLAKD